jgi:hypothetical protein
MEEYQERVVAERKELESKIDKLDNFIKSDAYNKLGDIDRVLLVRQLSAMNMYSNVLQERIDYFKR